MADAGREAAEPVFFDTIKADRASAREIVRGFGPAGSLGAADRALNGVLCLSVAALLTLPTAVYIWRHEGGPADQLFVWSVSLTFAAAIVFGCRSTLVASVLVNASIAIVEAVAAAKQETMNVTLHAYDLFVYLSSRGTIDFLWSGFRKYVLALALALLFVIIAGCVAYWFDVNRVRRRSALLATVLLALLSAIAAEVKGDRRHTQAYYDDKHLSSFYSSWAETLQTLWRGQLIEAADSAPGPRFAVPTECTTASPPPHIILIHQESVVPPGYFPTLRYDHRVDRLFVSQDGKTHRLRVETYGGASWLTEFSIMTGVSTYSFGGMRQFVQSLLVGKVHDTLPETLTRCGYRTVVFYPLLRNFVSYDKFYGSVGLKEIYDSTDQGAKTDAERDRFYFGNALDEVARHLRQSRHPLFTYILTMATHSPYDTVYMPEIGVPGGGPGTDPEMSEYLRRLAMAQMDYEELKGEIARRFPGERFLIVHYGDHHPVATRSLLGFGKARDAEDVSLPPESLGFITYYAVDSVNYQVPPLPEVETLDVPYMPVVILNAARLPLSDSFRERQRVLTACEGRYFTCRPRDTILTFHRRLIDSGLVDTR
jgi:hypothetical protein